MGIKKVLPQESAAAVIFSRFEREIPRGKVDEETRRVCILATLAACGGKEAFEAELGEALEAGLSPLAAHEAVLQSAAYLGMGRALPFLQALYAAFAAHRFVPRALRPVRKTGCVRHAFVV